MFDGRDFNLEEVDKTGEILINGKKKRRARLVHNDRITLGDAELQFSIFDEPHGTVHGSGVRGGSTLGSAPMFLASVDGAVYVVFRDRETDRWFVDAIVD